MTKTTILDSLNKLKLDVHGKIGASIEALRSREFALLSEIDSLVKLEYMRVRDDEDDDEEEGEDGGNKRWRVVGNWKELQDVIGRVGSVVEVRSRNESFEVLEHEKVVSVVSEKNLSDLDDVTSNEDDDEEEEEDDDDGGANKKENDRYFGSKSQRGQKGGFFKSFQFIPRMGEGRVGKALPLQITTPFKFCCYDNLSNISANTNETDATNTQGHLTFDNLKAKATEESEMSNSFQFSHAHHFQPFKFSPIHHEASTLKDVSREESKKLDAIKPFFFNLSDDSKLKKLESNKIEKEHSNGWQHPSYQFKQKINDNSESDKLLNSNNEKVSNNSSKLSSFKFDPANDLDFSKTTKCHEGAEKIVGARKWWLVL